ncbi:MAG: hypothetical protein EPN82_12505 [Bacteroidetes bacterium]|nr:MAG: hypothetical protein EPN82_12505 [Bacteroidota bacterium]
MDSGLKEISKESDVKTFTQRLDFYWQFISVYAIALFIYFFLKGLFFDATFSKVARDPVVILLVLFITGSGLALLYNIFRKRSITVGKDYLLFSNRFSGKLFHINDIISINIVKEKIPRSRRKGVIRIIRIKIKDRKRFIRIRMSSFWNSKEFVNALLELRKNVEGE